jgi:hypothetical protein
MDLRILPNFYKAGLNMDKTDFGQLSDREILIIVATEQHTIQQRINDHGQRLRVLEGFAKTAAGAVAIASVIVGWFKVEAHIK